MYYTFNYIHESYLKKIVRANYENINIMKVNHKYEMIKI